jgi:hypothetical protein
MKTDNSLLKLLDEIDVLCAVYVGKNAPNEPSAAAAAADLLARA